MDMQELLSVCEDCYVASAGIPTEGAELVPLGRLTNAVAVDPATEPECGDGYHFSWQPCPGCGSRLGGNRYDVIVVWKD